MADSRRKFLSKLGGIAGGLAVMPATILAAEESPTYWDGPLLAPKDVPSGSDEDFWSWVRLQYALPPGIINFNSGGVSPHPRVVEEAMIRLHKEYNKVPSMNRSWQLRQKNLIRKKLAKLAGCSAEELAINRNATEALNTVIMGLDLKRGDEVVVSHYDYPAMKYAWIQREQRDGVVLKWVDLKLPSTDSAAMTKAYTDQFSKKTKVVHLTHLINWTGQVLPVRQIADEAKRQGCEVIVDAAHSFAHLDFKIPDLNCDYLGTSLHKWLGAPFGTGMLYVKQEKIEGLWPLFPAEHAKSKNIRKFEHLGTRDFSIELAIDHAISFHEMIGIKRKFNRLFELRSYYHNQLKELPNFKAYAPLDPKFSGGICTFSVGDFDYNDMNRNLLSKHGVHAVVIKLLDFEGIRITPNVFTTHADLDQLVTGITEIIS